VVNGSKQINTAMGFKSGKTVQNTRVTGFKVDLQVEANSLMLMAMLLKANGEMGNYAVRQHLSIAMALRIMGNLRTTFKKGKEKRFGPMVLVMKVNIIEVANKGWELTFGKMVLPIQVNGSIIRLMVRGNTHGKMVINLMGSGLIMKCMVMGFIDGPMAVYSTASMKTTKNTVMVYIKELMVV